MSVLSTAASLVGKVKYSFGSSSITASGGTGDCSSFIQYVFKQNGVNLPRTASAQAKVGTEVRKDQLQAGDLVFFQGTYKSGISHVGVYAGNGKFIHNSSSGGTKVSDLNSRYYSNHYATARRITGANTSTNKSANIVSIAQSMQGKVKYDFSHKNSMNLQDGTLKVDCTGFVKYVLLKAGLIDSNTSVDTLYKSKDVIQVKSVDDLQAGDVIYYAHKDGTIWHKNIYAGNGYVIESTRSANGWKKTKMSNTYKKDFYTAVRFPQQSESVDTTTSADSSGILSGVGNILGGVGANILTGVFVCVLFIMTFVFLFNIF